MVRNYVTIGIRNLLKHKGYSVINVLGLSVGIACCILIALYIQDEFAYERFHANGDRIYRLVRQTQMKGSNPSFNSRVMGPLAPAIQDALPEVEAAVRIWRSWKWVTYGDREFTSGFCVADGGVLEVFSFPLVRGDLKTALKDPYSVVITEKTARRYFGDEDPIGKVLTAHTKYIAGDYTVTGVLKDLPRQSHLSFDILTTTVTSSTWMQAVWNHWRPESGYRPIRIYLMLKKNSDPVELERKLPALVQRVLGQEFKDQNTYHLQPISRIRLYSHIDYGFRGGGDIQYVYMLSSIALFVLIIACINFMNLATARSATRAKEVGMRKVVGAYRAQVIHQFLGESILVSSLDFSISLLMVKLALPPLNAFTWKELTLFSLDNALLLSMLPILAVSVGILAGSYPAFFLSSFQPVQVLKGSQKVTSNVWLRKTLVIVQFAISVFLIIGTLIVYNQMSYIQTKRLGFDKDHLVMTHLFSQNQTLTSSYKAVKAAFLQHPDILKASASLTFVGI